MADKVRNVESDGNCRNRWFDDIYRFDIDFDSYLYCVFAGTGIKNRRRKLRRQRELDVYFQEHKDEIIKK